MGRKQVKKGNCPEGGDGGEISKKQRQTGEDIAKDNCVDVEALTIEIEGASAAKKAKGKKKGAKKNNLSDEDDIIQELQELSLETQGGQVNKHTTAAEIIDIEALATEIEETGVAKKAKGKKKGAKKNNVLDEDVIEESEELSPETQGLKFNKPTTEMESVVPPKPEKIKKKGNKGSQYEEGDEEEGQGNMEKIIDQKDQAAPSDSIPSGFHSHQKTMGDKKTDKNKKGPSKATVKHIKDRLAKLQEEEERAKRKEEEERKRLEEQEQQRLELERLEQARKEKRKQEKKERMQRLKKEGKFLTKAQKEDRARAEATLEILQAQGVKIPSKDSVSKNKPVYGDKRRKKVITAANTPGETSPSSTVSESPEPESPKPTSIEPEMVTTPVDKPDTVEEDWEDLASSDDVSWETLASSDDKKYLMKGNIEVKEMSLLAQSVALSKPCVAEGVDEGIEKTALKGNIGKKSEQDSRVSERSVEKQAENICNINLGKLRAPLVCVLGHVDTGKTKILDKLRHTQVQVGEAGGITQQIGATNVPLKAIIEQTKMVPCFDKDNIKIPGMLLIDTPGHESFRNLRIRGSSLCDIAILVVDIMHGLENQTLESIKLLKEKKCPFIVALNKIDRLVGWEKSPLTDIVTTLTKQKRNTKDHFDQQAKDIIGQFSKEGLNAALFHENKDQKRFVSLVPTSAHTGDGIGNLIALLVNLAQTRLVKTLAHSDKLNAHVMEVKTLPGTGTTIDVILINGSLKVDDIIIVPGVDGPIITEIKGLLLPPPLKDLRVVTNQHVRLEKVCTSQGVRIIANNLEKTLAGLPLFVASRKDEIPLLKEELDKLVMETMNTISLKKEKKGVYVQASTMGSLEALLDFLHTSKVPYAGINIGPVHKNDIMNASTMLEHDPLYAVILAFDVKVERDIQEMAERHGVRVFSADIIYNLFDEFTKYREEYMKAKQEEFKHIAVFPVKLKIIPHSVFKSRDPILIGVTVEDGILRLGTPLCVVSPVRGLVNIGIVTSIEVNHKPIVSAKKDQQVCVRIDHAPGESPKMVGRHFEETDCIVSKICRESIDALKNWFRDDMANSDWKLIKELKVTFEII